MNDFSDKNGELWNVTKVRAEASHKVNIRVSEYCGKRSYLQRLEHWACSCISLGCLHAIFCTYVLLYSLLEPENRCSINVQITMNFSVTLWKIILQFLFLLWFSWAWGRGTLNCPGPFLSVVLGFHGWGPFIFKGGKGRQRAKWYLGGSVSVFL